MSQRHHEPHQVRLNNLGVDEMEPMQFKILKNQVHALSLDYTVDHRKAAYEEIQITLGKLIEATNFQIERKKMRENASNGVNLSRSAAIEDNDRKEREERQSGAMSPREKQPASPRTTSPREKQPASPRATSPTKSRSLSNSASSSHTTLLPKPSSPRGSQSKECSPRGDKSPRPLAAFTATPVPTPVQDNKLASDPGVVRKPKTSYIFFVEEKSDEYRRTEHHGMGPSDMLKQIGAQWKAFSHDEKKKYYELEIDDERRYSSELARAQVLRASVDESYECDTLSELSSEAVEYVS